MTQTHHPDVEVVDGSDASMFSGLMLMVVALLVVAVIAFAVLWTRPWQSSSSTNNVPTISDNSGQPGGGQSGGNQSGGGTGGQSGGSGGNSQPQQPAQ